MIELFMFAKANMDIENGIRKTTINQHKQGVKNQNSEN